MDTPGTRGIRILIVGGGIGGLAAGLALAARGHRPVVLEKSEDFAEIGAGLQLGPNALRVLDALGVLDRIRPLAVFPSRLVLADVHSGEDIVRLELDDRFSRRFGETYLVMHRHDLLLALLAACRELRVELLPGKDVIHVEDHGDAVVVRCADGAEYRGDGVVGADGVHSRTRTQIIDDDLINDDFVAYRGTIRAEQASRLARPDAMVMWIGPGVHFVQYPLRGGTIFNQVAVFQSLEFRQDSEDWGSSQELTERFAGACDAVGEGMRAIRRDRRWPMIHRQPASRMARNRLALLGDAAHPMLQYLAQGACQALEDAYVLGSALSSTGDVVSAFELYERARLERTGLVQRAARVWGEVCHVDGVGRTIRDELFSRIADLHDELGWLYGHDATAPVSDLAQIKVPWPGAGTPVTRSVDTAVARHL